jgi:hypothetical protein
MFNSTDIIHYEWSWENISLDDFDLETITPHLTMMEAAGLKGPTLQDLQTLKLEASRSPGWPTHYVYMTCMGILALMVLSAISHNLYMYNLFYLRTHPKFRIPMSHAATSIELCDLSPPLHHQQQQ